MVVQPKDILNKCMNTLPNLLIQLEVDLIVFEMMQCDSQRSNTERRPAYCLTSQRSALVILG
jgi:hypothetical protein